VAFIRGTMFFQLRTAGWSESWYFSASDLDSIAPKLAAISNARLALCNGNVELVGRRIGFVNPPHASQSNFFQIGAPSLYQEEVPFMSLLFELRTNTFQKRQLLLRATPDDVVVNGQYMNNLNFSNRINTFIATLQAQQALIRVADPANLPVNVASVNAGGVVTTLQDLILDVNDQIRFFRTKDAVNLSVGLPYRVLSVQSARQFTLNNWPAGRLVTTGRVRKIGFNYLPISSFLGPRKVVSRKVGRVFNEPVGRRRRRT
jgi:hypothetical protein